MIIDAHAHLTAPPEVYEYFRGFIGVPGPAGRGLRRYEVADDRLEAALRPLLDAPGGRDATYLLSTQPWSVPSAERRAPLVMTVTQAMNDLVAQGVRLHPQRFAGIAALPQTPALMPKDCLEELERCVGELGFCGAWINPDPGEGASEVPDMGTEYWYPLYEKLQQLALPGLIHGGASRFAREPEMGYVCQEESVAGWALMRSPRVFRDFPRLKLVLCHGGGYIPYQFGRARCFRLNERRRAGSDGDDLWEPFEETLRRFYFDTVLYDRESLELLFRVCGTDRCLFGSGRGGKGAIVDSRTRRPFDDVASLIDSIDWLSESDRLAIYESNAKALFPRLRD